jgi:hypothetical protein
MQLSPGRILGCCQIAEYQFDQMHNEREVAVSLTLVTQD